MGRPAITKEVFMKRVEERFPEEEFEIVEYFSIGKPLKIRCMSCDEIISIKVANNFLAPNKVNGCVHCKGLHIEREKKIKRLLEDYILIDDTVIINTHRQYTLKCKRCGHVRTSLLNNFIVHPECGCVTGVYHRTHEQFVNEVKKIKGEEYQVVDNFTNMLKKVTIKHLSCGRTYKARPTDILYENLGNCPYCDKQFSSKALFIKNLLEEQLVEFEVEKRVSDTRQFFDFFLIVKNKKIAIEYNGEQHYSFNSHFHKNEVDFERQQERDSRKEQYCKENDILLCVIPYTKSLDEIKTIILNLLSEGSTTIRKE